jgi:ATP-dependent Clp protease ATP-binding subunit ClpC
MVGESQEPVGSTVGGGSGASNKMPTLEEYGTNLTAQAEEVGMARGGEKKRATPAAPDPDPAPHPTAALRGPSPCRRVPSLLSPRVQGKLDPVVGRKKEIERVTQILGRRTKNNPCLVGERPPRPPGPTTSSDLRPGLAATQQSQPEQPASRLRLASASRAPT